MSQKRNWGGARPNAGRKKNGKKPALPAVAAEPRKAAESTLNLTDIEGIVRALQATSRQRAVDPGLVFKPAQHPPKAMPPKKYQMAMDDASSAWASGELAAAAFGGVVSEGLLFLGYPYLSELAQRPEYRVISETIGTESTRKWIEFKGTGDEDKTEKIKELVDAIDNYKLRDRMADVATLDGFFGRSHLFPDFGKVTDEELKTPIGDGRSALSKSKIKRDSLRGFRAIEPVWVYPTTYNAQNPLAEDWYNPQVWYVMGRQIHRSRLPTFIGRQVPDLLKPAYSFGGLSLSQLAKPYVDIWLTTRQSIGEMIHAFSVMVLSTDMETILQPGNAGNLLARAALFNALRDNQGLMMVNKATEQFDNVSAPMGGLSDLQAQSQEHMASVSRIPIVKLTGVTPKGLNASSEGEMRAFYDTIAAYQNKFFRPNLTVLIDFVQLSLWGKVDHEITYDFVPLWELTEKEQAEARKTEAETDQIRVDQGAVSPAEVRTKVVNDPDSGFHGLNPDDVPDLAEEEEEGLMPGGKNPGGEGGGESDDEGGAAADAVIPFAVDAEFKEEDHPRDHGKFASSGGGSGTPHAPQFGLQHGKLTASHGGSSSGGGFGAKRGNVGEPIDPSKMKKVGGQKGSNPGGVFEDGHGGKFYVKKGKSKDHVRNEMIAAALYDLAGSPTLKYRPTVDGDHIATEMAKLDKDNASKLSPAEVGEAQAEFAVHAWLANWDAAGMGGDNVGTVNGVPTSLDLGGALAYRAQGAPKGKAFGDKVGELQTLRDPKTNADSARLFGDMTPAAMRKSARYVASIPDQKIRDRVEKLGGDAALADKLIARKNDIAEQARTFGAEGDPSKPTGVMVVPAGDAAPIKKLGGVAFKAWEPPPKWADVDGQIEMDEPELEVPEGKGAASGVIVREKDGRVWLVQPAGAFGGYEGTFPKGRAEEGLSLQANAIKEAYEESGLKVRITGHAGDHAGDQTMTRYYFAEREGGDPSQHGDETEGVVLAPVDKLHGFLNRDRDRKIVGGIAGDEAQFEENKHPRDSDGQFTSGGGSAKGKTLEEWQESQKAIAGGKPKKTAFGGLWKTGGDTPAANFTKNVNHVLAKPANSGSSYRQMLAHMIKEADKHGEGMQVPKLKAKLADAYNGAYQKAIKMAAEAGNDAEAAKFSAIADKAEAEAKKLGWPVAAAKPAEQQMSPSQQASLTKSIAAKLTPPTAEELNKAKKNVALQVSYVPGSAAVETETGKAMAQKLVDVFNEKYAGKTLTDPEQLAAKVATFKALTAAVASVAAAEADHKTAWAQKEKAEAAEKAKKAKAAQDAAAQAAAEKNKGLMKSLGITEQEAYGFVGLAKMLGGNQDDIVASFKKYEEQAKAYGYPITGFQCALIKNYSDGGYAAVNSALRSGTWSKEQHVYVKMVNKALAGMPRHKGVLNRGASLSSDDQQRYVAGNVVEERAFTSTSTGKGFSGNTSFKITAIGKRGASIKQLSNHSGENEVLFAARTFFHVTKVDGKPGGQMTVHMEEMEDEDV